MLGTNRPLADPSRAEMAQRMFNEGLSPEEYAARHSHWILCFSLGDLRYSGPALDAWVQRFNDILSQQNGAPKIEDLREKLLTPEERQNIQQQIQDMIDNP
jgi:hypothetical protein